MTRTLTYQELNTALMRGDYILLADDAEKKTVLRLLEEHGWHWVDGRCATAIIPHYTPCCIMKAFLSTALQYGNPQDEEEMIDVNLIAWHRNGLSPRFAY